MLRRILSTATALAAPRYHPITTIATMIIVVVWQEDLSQNQERLRFGDHLSLELVIANHQRRLALLGDKIKQGYTNYGRFPSPNLRLLSPECSKERNIVNRGSKP